jgi:hypothetical protein
MMEICANFQNAGSFVSKPKILLICAYSRYIVLNMPKFQVRKRSEQAVLTKVCELFEVSTKEGSGDLQV